MSGVMMAVVSLTPASFAVTTAVMAAAPTTARLRPVAAVMTAPAVLAVMMTFSHVCTSSLLLDYHQNCRVEKHPGVYRQCRGRKRLNSSASS
jgi:hypothetical protein